MALRKLSLYLVNYAMQPNLESGAPRILIRDQ